MSTDAQLPPGWAWTTTGELFESVTSGSRGWAQFYSEKGPTFLRIGNLTRTHIDLDLDDLQHVCVPNKVEGQRTRARAGDILVSITADIGSIAVVPDDLEEAYVNQHLALSRPHPSVEPRYLAWFLRCDSGGQRQFLQLRRGATKAGLGLDDIRAVRVPFAPLAEQRRIVAKVEELFVELDEAVAELERVRANLKRYRAAVLKAAVSGELTADWRANHPATEPASALLARILADRRAKWEADQLKRFAAAEKDPPKNWQAKYTEPTPPDTISLPKLPDGWTWTSLEQLLHGIEGGKSFKCLTRPATAGEWGVIKVSAMTWGDFDEEEQKAIPPASQFDLADEIRPGDLLLSRCNTTELVGATVLVGVCRARLLLSDKSLRLLTSECVNRPWLHKALSSSLIRRQLSAMATGTSDSMRNVSQEKIVSVTVPLPPLAEQEAIVAEVEARLSDVSAAEAVVSANLTRAARLRQSILKEVFAGRLVPQDPADEPAAVLLERIKAAKPCAPIKKSRGRTPAVAVNEAIVDVLAFAVPTAADAGPLNRTKIQKFAAVQQTHYGTEIVERFLQAPYGPYAPEIEEMEPVCGERGYFTVQKQPKGERGLEVRYVPGENAEAGRAAGVKRFGKKAADAERLLRHIRAMSTDDAELFATVYAVWNDLLLDGQPADEAAIVAGVYAWNVKKKKFPAAVIRTRIAWMREAGYVPTGRGQPTAPTTAAKATRKRKG